MNAINRPDLFVRLTRSLVQVVLLLSAITIAQSAIAFTSFRISEIRIEGNEYLDNGTILDMLSVRTEDVIDDTISNDLIKNLYESGFFKQITVSAEGRILIIRVLERPAVSEIAFTGVKQSDKEGLTKALRTLGIQEGKPFDPALVAKAELEIKRQYLARGLYSATIATNIAPQEKNRVKVSFTVSEGEVAQIKHINIIGNKFFSESDLLDLLNLRAPGFFTWYTSADQYSRQKLSADLEILRSYYQDRGFIEMQIESTQVSITPNKKDIYITINISEGQRYTISDIKLDGYTLGIADELRALVTIKPNDLYSALLINESQKAMSERLGKIGYAFSNVYGNPDIDKKNKKVALTFLVDPGKRVYVRSVNIIGNTQTRDYVIRRQLRQYEKSWYDSDKIKLSRDRVDRLGFFSEVAVETPEVIGTNDQVDLNLSVKEKSTGTIVAGLGYSTTDKLSLQASVQQPNLFGTGEFLGFQINSSTTSKTYTLSTSNPYFTKYGVSRSFDFSSQTSSAPVGSLSQYDNATNSTGVRFGIPYSETGTVFAGIGYENVRIDATSTSPVSYLRYVSQFGNGTSATTTTYPITLSWQTDNRDSGLIPTRGTLQRFNAEIAIFGDLNYYRAGYNLQFHYPLTRKLTFSSNYQLDHGAGLNAKQYPVFKNYYLGGLGSVRGYVGSSLAPEGVTQVNNVGGNTRTYANLELLGPFPGSGNDRTLRWFMFIDGGAVYNEVPTLLGQDFHYGTGFGVAWVSAIGPLKFNWARALNPRSTDQTQYFQFQIGTVF